MISLAQLAQTIQKKLNNNISDFSLNSFFPNVNFEFNICLNAGEYKKAVQKENSNEVKYYINAVMKVLSSEVEGEPSVATTYNATMSTSIEFLIPFSERKGSIGAETVKFGDQVHLMISSLLQAGLSSDMVDNNDKTYLVGSTFTIPSPSTKEIRSLIGESISFTIYGTHYFIASGVNSNRIKLFIDGAQVFASRIGIARRSITEGNIFSGSSASKNTVSGTTLTITFDAPLRMGGYNNTLAQYLVDGTHPTKTIENTARPDSPLSVHLVLPYKDESPGASANTPKYVIGTTEYECSKGNEFKMIIADAGMNGELGLAASINVRLIEAR